MDITITIPEDQGGHLPVQYEDRFNVALAAPPAQVDVAVTGDVSHARMDPDNSAVNIFPTDDGVAGGSGTVTLTHDQGTLNITVNLGPAGVGAISGNPADLTFIPNEAPPAPPGP